MKKIGVLELCAGAASGVRENIVDRLERKQFVSLTPQAVSVWCRQLGHEVRYATYNGVGDPKRRLPNDLDIVFITSHSGLAPLAYALAKAYRLEGTRTVIGGPHAKSFPRDALRYFDLVVLECDRPLIADIVADRFEPHSVVSSPKPFEDCPTIEERLPELKASVFWNGRPYAFSMIPMLASIGCPYSCDFCTDWNSRYQALPAERLLEDLRYASENLPGGKLFFCDPNFGVRFDETLSLFETIPTDRRSPYLIETSLSNLRSPKRLKRLQDTNCQGVAPGIESWTQYSNKAAVGKAVSREKLERVVEHLQALSEYVPYLQANFILGLDTDDGDEPFELMKEFLYRTPFVWPNMNIPMAFGGTPLYSSLLKQGRILKAMPFTFYQYGYLTVILKNYDALSYFRRIVELFSVMLSNKMLRMRLAARTAGWVKFVNAYRTFAYGPVLSFLTETLQRLQTDSSFRAFHAGETQRLPEAYAREYYLQLGKYAELMPIEDSQPELDDQPVQHLVQLTDSLTVPGRAGIAGATAGV